MRATVSALSSMARRSASVRASVTGCRAMRRSSGSRMEPASSISVSGSVRLVMAQYGSRYFSGEGDGFLFRRLQPAARLLPRRPLAPAADQRRLDVEEVEGAADRLIDDV